MMVSCASPGSRVNSNLTRSETRTLIPSWILVLNPWKEAVTRYTPIGNSGATKRPFASVVNSRLPPVSWFWTTSEALGMAAPELSRIVPTIDPCLAAPSPLAL